MPCSILKFQGTGEKFMNYGAGFSQMGANMLSSLGNSEGSDEYNQQIQQGTEQGNGISNQGYQNAQQLFNPYMQAGQQGLQGMQNWQAAQPGQFQGAGSVQSFLDPSMAYQQQQVSNQVQGTAGPAGLSGSALKQLAAKTQNVAQTGWNNAFQQQQQSNNNLYNQYAQNFAMRNQSAQENYNKFANQSQMGMGATNQLASYNQQNTNNRLTNNQAATSSAANNAYVQGASPYDMMGGLLGGLGQMFGGQ